MNCFRLTVILWENPLPDSQHSDRRALREACILDCVSAEEAQAIFAQICAAFPPITDADQHPLAVEALVSQGPRTTGRPESSAVLFAGPLWDFTVGQFEHIARQARHMAALPPGPLTPC